MKNTNTPSFSQALLLVIILIIIFSGSIIGLGLAPFVPLTLSIIITMIFAKLRHASWDDIQDQLLSGIKKALAPLFLFLLIGMLIALWMGTNVIPTMLWIGFKIANASFFIPSALLVTAIVGTMVGSAFTTLATVGVALMGVGTAMGFNPALVAGAVLSGAIFGDKSSPLSDSTNLASSISETDLFAHIKNLMWTTIPALVVSFIIFTFLGLGHADASTAKLDHLASLLSPTWWTIVPLGLLVGMAWLKIPAIPTLLINVGVSGAFFMLNHSATTLGDLLLNGFTTTSKNDILQALLNRGGMMSMMQTVIIIMLALGLGGLLTEQKILQAVMAPIAARIKGSAGIITGTVFTGIAANFMIGEQYLATILPGQLWKDAFDRVGLSRLALGRSLEDSGTVVNYLVPWGVAGSFAAQTLGVPVHVFLPFVFFALLSPVFSLISAWTGLGIKKVNE